MFTGLVEQISKVEKIQTTKNGDRVWILKPKSWKELELGESISVSGTCLTLSKIDGNFLVFDRSKETIACTTLPELINLERALVYGKRMGGHLVFGHVDGVLKVEKIKRTAKFEEWIFKLPSKDFYPFLVQKGSITIAGVSLTISEVLSKKKILVFLVPHTIKNTCFRKIQEGDLLNFEIDMLAKYSAKQVGLLH